MRMPLFAVLSALLCLSAAPGLVLAEDVPAPDPAPSAATPVAKDPVFSGATGPDAGAHRLVP
jgi:hypothetical protein